MFVFSTYTCIYIDDTKCLYRDNNFVQRYDVLHRYDVRVEFVGDLSLFPQVIVEGCHELSSSTRSNRGPVLNICLGYTSTNELLRRIAYNSIPNKREAYSAQDPSNIVNKFEKDRNKGHDPNELASLSNLPSVDLLIRTSGEERLSDFMLLESQYSTVFLFLNPLWPALKLRHFVYCILEYQRVKALMD